MTALSSEQRARHHELTAVLKSLVATIRELPNGMSLNFRGTPILTRLLPESRLWNTRAALFSISAFALRVEATSSAGG